MALKRSLDEGQVAVSASRQPTDPTVDVRWVADHVGDPSVQLVEVDVSRAAYDQGHIPGALCWDAYVDLRDPAYRPVSPQELQRLFSRSGISPDTTVVLYGYAAALGFWLMKAHGHRDVRVLRGPRDQWIEAGERWTTDVPKPEESAYPLPKEDDEVLAPRQALEGAIDRPGEVILDVRSKLEYQGERFWPSGAAAGAGRAGHVPGAVSVPIDALREAGGAPKVAAEQRRAFEAAGVTKDKAVITYCTIGNRAAEAWFALTYELGYPNVRVYYDSWAVWGKLADSPVEA
jgi:thiosulfate/3-mercaptopyruvate sulfurtransferase